MSLTRFITHWHRYELRDSDTAAVIDYLANPFQPATNNYQKAISSLQLADILFKQKNYTVATSLLRQHHAVPTRKITRDIRRSS